MRIAGRVGCVAQASQVRLRYYAEASLKKAREERDEARRDLRRGKAGRREPIGHYGMEIAQQGERATRRRNAPGNDTNSSPRPRACA